MILFRLAAKIIFFLGTATAFAQNDMLVLGPNVMPPPADDNPAYITYLIRFQNTLGVMVQDVVVTDTFDARLDVSTLEVLGSSHPYFQLHDQSQVVRWQFKNIQLPDAEADEAASRGYLMFRIRPKPFIASGQVIANRAKISFDNTGNIFTPLMLVLFDEELSNQDIANVPLSLRLGPNPNTGSFRVFHRYSGTVEARLANAAGRIVWQGEVQSGDQLQISGETPGLYVFYVKNGTAVEQATVVIR